MDQPRTRPWHRLRVSMVVVLAASWLATTNLALAADTWPDRSWTRATPIEAGMELALLEQARDYAGGSGMIIRGGRLVMAWGDTSKRYDLKSSTKSIGATALGLAVGDGLLSLTDKAVARCRGFGAKPEGNTATAWLEDITLEHLATHTAGFDKSGAYTPLLFAPGSQWSYSDGGPNWLAECITLAYRRDLYDLLFARVFAPIGIRAADLTWRDHAYRPELIEGIKRREFGSGIRASVDAMARIGYLYLRSGVWNGTRLLPEHFVRSVGKPIEWLGKVPVREPDKYPNAAKHYGLLWWNNGDGVLPSVPRDAYWSWGLRDSLIIVIPSLDLVIARAGPGWRKGWDSRYGVIAPFLNLIVGAITANTPYPPSPVISSLIWAPKSRIRRGATDSDNWPLTWAGDDDLYAAYGDGHGFAPHVPNKLSLGFARISGGPTDFVGENIRSHNGEQRGNGPLGKKASGLLMVDGVLYMWVRNALNAQLAWSTDHARSWTWANWRFETSIGYPTFVNYGRDYEGARDGFVYAVSHDHDSAYAAADRMLLFRAPKGRLAEKEAWSFFSHLDARGEPVWTASLAQRGAVFTHEGSCRRSGISYHPTLKRYIWWQGIPHDGDERSSGGIGIYDAPEPWGPWTTVYYAQQWDIGPGDAGGFPTKWMSEDGRRIHLVFAGDDSFSVRGATLSLNDPPNASDLRHPNPHAKRDKKPRT